jgi:hypothetical protein
MIPLERLLTQAGDLLFEGMLWLPRDLTLLLLAALLIALLLGLRWLLADRDTLRLLAADEHRVRNLQAAARSAGDGAALCRHRRVRRLLAARRARLEMVPALAGLLPALFVLHWGARRLEFLPLRTGEPVVIEATFGASAIGRPAHLVPQESLSAEPAWIRMIEPADDFEARGTAEWRVSGGSSGKITLMLRHPGGSLPIPLELGTGRYERPMIRHEGDVITHVQLLRYRPLGVVPPLSWPGLPAWVIGLLLLTVPGYLATRRLLRMP